MFRGSFIELNWSAKALTDLRELRSSFRTSMRAVGFFSMMVFLASDAASVFLTAMTTWAPLRAKTLEVSRPMPLAPPDICQKNTSFNRIRKSIDFLHLGNECLS